MTIRREVFSLAWPAILQALLHTSVFIADRALLGRYGTDELSSMQISGPLMWGLVSVLCSVSVGGAAVAARAWGAGDRARARKAAAWCLMLVVVIGVAAGGALRLGAGWLAFAFGLPAPVAVHAAHYLQILAPALPALFLAVAGTAMLRAVGDTRTPLLIGGLANLVNLVGDVVLIFGLAGVPALGVDGAALASGAAMLLEATVVLAVLGRGRGRLRLAARDLRGGRSAVLRPLLKVSGPAALEKVVFHAGYLIFAGLVARLGTQASAAHQVCLALESLSFIPADGFGIAAAALVGHKLGAGRPDEARAVVHAAAGMALAFLCGMGALYLLVPGGLVSAFTDDPAVRPLAITCLMLAALEQPAMALTGTVAEALKGAGDTRSPLLASIIGIWGVRLAVCWALAVPAGLGLVGIWLGTAIEWTVRAAFLCAVFRRGRWAKIEL